MFGQRQGFNQFRSHFTKKTSHGKCKIKGDIDRLFIELVSLPHIQQVEANATDEQPKQGNVNSAFILSLSGGYTKCS